jgi:hypothetical protein
VGLPHLHLTPKSLLAITNGEHTLGGIAGEEVAETTDEDPARVVLVADTVSAYLLDAFDIDHATWRRFVESADASDGTCSIDSK